MKYLKMLGLAAVAAMALTAFIGASSASADVLCTATTTPCNARVTSLSLSLKSGTKLVLRSSFKSIECGKSSLGGNVLTQGSSQDIVLGVTTMTFEECNCPTMKVLKGGTLTAQKIGTTETATVSSSGAEVTMICEDPIFHTNFHCTYVTNNTDLGILAAGSPATLNMVEVIIPVEEKNSDFVCPEESKWTATYVITNHSAVYVENE
jgi:hypothetical protein